MLDAFNRKIEYLRISITDRCNLRCQYCMPAEGIELMSHNEILSFEEIRDVVSVLAAKGIRKIRLTGGEPLVRKGVVSLVKQLAEIPGIEDLSLTTNGLLLDQYAFELKEAGLNRVNISLDTMNPERFRELTRGGDIKKVLNGIAKAKEAGLDPIKINCVVLESSGEADAVEVADFCRGEGLKIRYIHKMDLRTGNFTVVEGGEGGDCKSCNRLRLTANGMLKPCLFSDLEYNVRILGVEKALELALGAKPECGSKSNSGHFSRIGG